MSTADTFSPGLSPHGVKGGDPAEGLGGGLPASLPDEAYLTRLANEMFAQAPGGGPPGLNPGGLQPSGLQGGAPSSPSLAADAPGLGAVGMMSNSNLRPSAHGASIPGMAAPRGVPSAIPMPGEAELRALLAPRLSSPVATQPIPGANPVNAEALALSGTDAPGLGAARGPEQLEPAAFRRMALPCQAWRLRGARPSAIPLPGEAELRALLSPRLTSPVAGQPLPGADPAAAALALSGADAPGAGAVGGQATRALVLRRMERPWPATPAPSEAPMMFPRRLGASVPPRRAPTSTSSMKAACPRLARSRHPRNRATTSMPCAATFPSSTSGLTATR